MLENLGIYKFTHGLYFHNFSRHIVTIVVTYTFLFGFDRPFFSTIIYF